MTVVRSGHGSREAPGLEVRDLSRHQVGRCGFGNIRSRWCLENTANEFTILSASRAVVREHVPKNLKLGLGIVRSRSGTFAGRRSNSLGSVAVLQRPSLLRTRWTDESVGPRRTHRRTICSGSEVLTRNDRCRTHSRSESRCLPSRLGNGACRYCKLLASKVQTRGEWNSEAPVLGTPMKLVIRGKLSRELIFTYLPPRVKPPMNGVSQTTSIELAFRPMTTPFMDK